MLDMATGDGERSTKKIRIFRNGDMNFFGKEVVINRRQMRDYGAFLQAVTDQIQLGEAVRSLRTPRGGTKIEDHLGLEELQDKGEYVAVGNGSFKKISYLSLDSRHSQRLNDCRRRREENLKESNHRRIQVSGKIRKPTKDVVSIYVFCNGDEFELGKRVILTPRMLTCWYLTCDEITSHLNTRFGAVKRLYTMDGSQVRSASDLRNNVQYVAAGAYTGFKKVDYGLNKPIFNLTVPFKPRPPEKKLSVVSDNDLDLALDPSNPNTARVASDPVVTKHKSKHRRTRVITTDGKPVFPWRPVKHNRKKKSIVVDYDRDEGGVFKAKGRREETSDAEEIGETNETSVDLPLDFTEAKEIEDEELYRESAADEVTLDQFESPRPHSRHSYTAHVVGHTEQTATTPPRDENTEQIAPGPFSEVKENDESLDRPASRPPGELKGNESVASNASEENRKKESAKKERQDADAAAVKIQAAYRGHKTRKYAGKN